MPQPFASGTTVTHTPESGYPFDGIVKGNTIELYLPLGDGTYVKRVGVWDDGDNRWEFGNPNFELMHLPGPPLGFHMQQGEESNVHGTCQAVA